MRTSPIAVALALLPLLALAEPGRDPIQTLAESYARQAVEQASTPRAVAPLIRLHQLSGELEELNVAVQAYAQVLSKPGADPQVRTVARHLLLSAERARGRLTKAQELSRQLGFITDAYVLGSFDNEGKGGCDTDFGVEGASIDLQAKYPISGREVGWVELAAESQNGYVNLGEILRPNTEAVAYALTFLESPRDQKVTLALGTSGAHRLWVNGEKVASADRYNAPRPDQSRVAVPLKKGTNRLLLKLCQERGPLGFFLRQENGDAKVALRGAVPPLPRGKQGRGEAVATVTDWFARQVEKNPNDAELRIDYATVLEFFRAFDDREHQVTVQAQKAAELAPGNALLQVYAAELDREDHNRQRRLLESALKADPASPLAIVSLAGHEVQREHPERALALLTPLVKERPKFAAARLVLARAHQALGDWVRWSNEVEQLFLDAPRIPSVVREAAFSARRLERPQDELTRLRVALALRYDDEGSRRAAQQLLGDLGRVDESLREAELRVKLDPFDLGARLELAELYASNGKLDEGRRAFREARQLAPDAPEVYEREGRALLRAGLRDEAIAAFDRALFLRPQNPALKEAVRSLKGEDGSFGDKHLVDALALSKEADAYIGSEDAVMLADYTYTRVQPSGLSSQYHQVAVKVFTPRGADSWRSYPISFSPARQEVRILKARVTKPDGSVITSYGDGERNLNEPWSGMYYDTRARVLSFPSLAAGDVLELVYRLEDTALENLLSDYWGAVDYIQNTAPKLRYQFFVDMPEDRPLYWNRSQLPGVEHQIEAQPDGRVLYRWSARDVSRVVPEPGMPGWSEVAATLHVSTYQTWEQVGRYYWGLIRDQLTPNGEVAQATAEALQGVDRNDPAAVVRAIYGFVVKNTRYVALEFGIHGFKPYRVDRVLARRFGDCKDKASLIHSMLRVAGVDSRLVLLRMRRLGTLAPEPASLAAFNHAIVYVPSLDLYLDGTAEYHGARELPSEDRVANVLIVEPEGKSVFLTTPEATAEDNSETLEMEVALNLDGSAEVKGRTGVVGSSAPSYRRGYQSAATRRSALEQSWGQVFPGLRVVNVSVSDTTRLDEDVKLEYELRIPRYAEVLPNALRFSPFGSGRGYTQSFATLVERRFDLVMQGPWASTQTFRYPVPAGWRASSLPAPLEERSPFGSLRIEYKVEGDVLVCTSRFSLDRARVKADEYPAFRAFLNKVDQGFARKLQLERVGGQTAEAR